LERGIVVRLALRVNVSINSPVVGIFDASDDTVELLQHVLQHAGFQTIDAHVSDIKGVSWTSQLS
jgi:hypothetical protein